MLKQIYAFDFDGTLCENEYPQIGKQKEEVVSFAKQLHSEGHKIILYTCRNGELLEKAVKWCEVLGLAFDAVNENLPENIALYGGDTRKIYADVYIDDHAINPDVLVKTRK